MSTGRRISRNCGKDSRKYVVGGLTLVLCLILHRDALGLPQIESNSTHLQSGADTCHSWLNGQNLIRLEDHGHHGQLNADLVEITGVLLTDQIDENQFPYSSEQRRPISLDPKSLFNQLSTLPEVDGLEITPILIGTPNKDAYNGIVRLGFLQDRRPVIVKTLVKPKEEAKRMNEARGAMLLSAIGVGPHFHGIVREGGNFHLITDLIVGNIHLWSTSPTLQVLRQLETILYRFNAIRLEHLPENEILFQVMRTNSDQVLVVDADGFYEEFLQGNLNLRHQGGEGFANNAVDLEWFSHQQTPQAPRISWARKWYQILATGIANADLETIKSFMTELRDRNESLYNSVALEIKDLIIRWNLKVSDQTKEFFLSLDIN